MNGLKKRRCVTNIESPKMTSNNSNALGKALTVLEVITEDDRPIAVPDIVDVSGLPRQTVHRVLRQLEELGLVDRDPIRERYSPGERLAHIGMRSVSTRLRRGPAHAVLVDIVDQIGETCNVGMIEGAEVVYIDRVECDWPLRVSLHPGSHVPVHCTAIGKLLLAYMDDDARHEVLSLSKPKRYTKNTITDRDEMEIHLAKIRKQGYAINDQEDAVGLIALAVPIRDANGAVVAGMAVHAPTPRFSIEDAVKRLPLFEVAAVRVSRALFAPTSDQSTLVAE